MRVMSSWFENRKECILRDFVGEFFETKVLVDQLYIRYQEEKEIVFQEMDNWVGNEARKGPLWKMKDDCHNLFRREGSNVAERLFDWTVGSSFHECMKLKEIVYQKESYSPVYKELSESHNEYGTKALFDELHSEINDLERDIDKQIEKIKNLFDKAVSQIRRLLVNHSQNGLLVILLLENQKLCENVLGKGNLEELFSRMYPNGREDAYYTVGKIYLEGGWYENAAAAFKKAIQLNPKNVAAKKGLEKTEKKLSLFHKAF